MNIFSRGELNDLYRYSISICGCENIGYDVLHTSIEKFLVKSEQIEIQYPRRYIMRMIKNEYVNTIRSDSRLEFSDEEVELEVEDFGQGLEKYDAKVVLDHCNSKEREILFLWAYEGMSYSEIAKQLEVSKGTILTRIHNFKKRILKVLNKGGNDE